MSQRCRAFFGNVCSDIGRQAKAARTFSRMNKQFFIERSYVLIADDCSPHVDAMATHLSLFLVGVLGRSSFLSGIQAPILILSCVSQYGANAQEQVRAVIEEHGHTSSSSAGVLLVSDEGDDEVGVAPTLRSEAVVMDDGTVVLPDVSLENTYQQMQTQQQHQNLPVFPHLGTKPSLDHNFTSYIHQPLSDGKLRYPEYKSGDQPYSIPASVRQKSDNVARGRREHVKAAMQHAWFSYREFAWGYDELLPVTQKGRNNWGGIATTLVDSMSTLWIMGMKDEFSESVDWIKEHLSFDSVGAVSLFETNIRVLGGLLSAYDVSGEVVLLEKGEDLAKRLMKSFESPSGIPLGRVNLKTGESQNAGWMKDRASLAEVATLQVEYRYLSAATGKQEYARAVERIFQIVESLQPDDGLIPIYIENTKTKAAIWEQKELISFGAHGDSAYEYMLKIWLQGGRREKMYRDMYDKAVNGLHEQLIFLSRPSGLTYVAQRQKSKPRKEKSAASPIFLHSMEELVCFVPGLLALGAYTDPTGLESDRAQRDLKTARALIYTCYEMHAQSQTGLAPETVSFVDRSRDFKAQNRSDYHLIRPETVESLYILNKLTGDPIYREFGWHIFQSIARYCKLPSGYGKLKSVENANDSPENMLESFVLSETFKYLYLLFDPDNELDPLNGIVFTTEAHPLSLLDMVTKPNQQSSSMAMTGSFPYLGSPPKTSDISSFQTLGGGRFYEYKSGDSPYRISQDLQQKSDDLARLRKPFIVEAMKHAWDGYKRHAFGHDELLPVSRKGTDPWGGMGTTLVDSLDTLWMMGLSKEFYEGRDWVRDNLNHDNVETVSVFETTIRSLGGLLAAYDLSMDYAFLEKADDLGSRLLRAFDSPSGIPYGQVHLGTGAASNIAWIKNSALLAEYSTLQVEFRYLAKVTGDREYAKKSERIFDILEKLQPPSGLLSLQTSNLQKEAKQRGKHISFGAMGDSAYEYFLKCWLQGGRKQSKYRMMYDKAIQGMHSELLQKSSPSGLSYVAEKVNGSLLHKFDHLVCFLPGTLALGAATDPYGIESPRAKRDLRTARALAYTCHEVYARTATGLAPEIVKFKEGSDMYVETRDSHYLLRPEAVESFFVLHHITGDPIYREWGWEIFLAIERFCKLPVAYGSYRNVLDPTVKPDDRMESFFLAETIKYLFLLFDPDTDLDIINKHVFNTEAHALTLLSEVEEVGKPPYSTRFVGSDTIVEGSTGGSSTAASLQQHTNGADGGSLEIPGLREELRIAEQTIAAQAAQLEHWKARMVKIDKLLEQKDKEISALRAAIRQQDANNG